MPVYEYLCEKCGARFERLKAKMATSSRHTCPDCGGAGHQQLTTFGIGTARSTGQAPCGVAACPSDTGACTACSCPYAEN